MRVGADLQPSDRPGASTSLCHGWTVSNSLKIHFSFFKRVNTILLHRLISWCPIIASWWHCFSVRRILQSYFSLLVLSRSLRWAGSLLNQQNVLLCAVSEQPGQSSQPIGTCVSTQVSRETQITNSTQIRVSVAGLSTELKERQQIWWLIFSLRSSVLARSLSLDFDHSCPKQRFTFIFNE